MKKLIYTPGNDLLKIEIILKGAFLISLLLSLSVYSMGQVKDSVTRDYRIRINRYDFDPLQNPPQKDAVLNSLNVNADTIYQLIQFKSSLTREQMKNLKEQNGLKLDQYIPAFTYIERVSRTQLESIRALPFYRWNGNYEPRYKIAQDITKRVKSDTADRRQFEKIIELHKDARPGEVADKLRSMGFEILNVWDDPKRNLKRLKIRLMNPGRLIEIAAIPEVKWIDEFGQINLRNQASSWILQTNTSNSRTIYDVGLKGQGEIIGHTDGPLDINHCFFNDAVNNTPGPGHRKVVAYRRAGGIPATFDDHGTHTAATAAGQDMISAGADAAQRRGEDGHAFQSRLSHADLDDVTGSGTAASNLRQLFEDMYSDGANVYTNSWGDDGTTAYTTWCVDIDQFCWDHEDALVVFAASNLTTLKTPENAKNCLAVAQSGFSNNQNNSDGGNGPTADGRRKPEITAPGVGIQSADANTACGTMSSGGTSMATPAVSGYAAITRQYFREGWYPTGTKRPEYGFTPSGALLKATLLNGTVDMTGTDDNGGSLAAYPSTMEGWGRLLLENVLYFPGDPQNLVVWDIRHANGLGTGETDTYTMNVTSNTQPLRITLAWTEPPAAANAAIPTINDIDLRVTAPDGTTFFLGNDFNAGQSRANGTTIDGINNVEMVLVNTPQLGQYVIQVTGTAINQGSQGYALVATADTQDPPVPTGAQNTLVVRTELPGTNPAGIPSETSATNLVTNLNAYITEASYGVTTITPSFATATLTTPLGTYLSANHNPLIEMTQDVVTQLITANPNVFTQGTVATNDDITRIVILINDRNFTGDWATTGGWPYDLPAGLTSRLSVSISSVFNDPDQRLAHAMAHQLGMMDLYAHPGVVFAQPHVDNWDIMANLTRAQPTAWSKEKALWLSTHNPNSILWIPRPAAAGPNFNESIALDFLSSANITNRRAIAIGLTPNVTDIADENVFYFVEARSNAAGTADAGLPGSGVLLYYVNENIRQGEGPVRIIDRAAGTSTLDDAHLDAVGQVHDLMGSFGIRVTRLATAGTENTRVRIEYDPIETQNDMNIVMGDPYWTSPDIWIDAPENGYDAVHADNGEQPVAGGTNRIYFRIHNPGPGTAFDVTVSVRLSEPHHTIGGEDDFNRFVAQKFYPSIAAGTDRIDFVDWTPVPGADAHNCIKVIIEDVFNDINTFNNTAQENVDVQESSTASPYEPVTFRFSATNPYDYNQLMYFKTEGILPGWTATFSEPKRLFGAHERFEGTLTVQPPDTALVCTDRQIYVTSWMPKGNTLIPLGGATLQVNLRNRTTLTATTVAKPCGNNKSSVSKHGFSNASCYTLTTTGCTNPVRANEDIIIRYQDPSGNPVYRTVRTDAMGCYSDTYVGTDGGEWKVGAKYPGTKCNGGSTTGDEPVIVSLPPKGGGPDGTGIFTPHLRKPWFSVHAGSSHPLGGLNKNTDANIYAMADLSFPLNNNLNLQLMYGLAQMTNSNTVAIKNPKWTHLSANVQAIFPRIYDMKPYLRAGAGNYSDVSKNNTIGANIGIGGVSQVKSQLIFSPGIDLHFPNLFSSKDNKPFFITAHIGFIFK